MVVGEVITRLISDPLTPKLLWGVHLQQTIPILVFVQEPGNYKGQTVSGFVMFSSGYNNGTGSGAYTL